MIAKFARLKFELFPKPSKSDFSLVYNVDQMKYPPASPHYEVPPYPPNAMLYYAVLSLYTIVNMAVKGCDRQKIVRPCYLFEIL